MNKLLETVPDLIEGGVEGAVFYIDGGQRVVQGKSKATFGVHAYFYKKELPKKGHGVKVFYPTADGYQEKSKTPAEEKGTILAYYDAFGPCPGGTNQSAEMEALIWALTFILDSKLYETVEKIRLFSDSEYTIKGTKEWKAGWKANGWRLKNGTPVSNKERWVKIDDLWEKVQAVDCDIQLTWVKGHKNYGNIIADYQASTGLFSSVPMEETISEPADYYETDNGYSKLLLDSKLYHLYELREKQDGLHQYLTFSHPSQGFDVKEDVGKEIRDFGIGIVQLKEAEPCLDMAIKTCAHLNETVAEVPVVIYLQNVLKPDTRQEFIKDLVKNFTVNPEGHVKALNGDPIITIINPSRLAYKLKPIYDELADAVYGYVNGKDSVRYNEVTDYFYDKIEKKSKESLKFKLSTDACVKVPAIFDKDGEDKESIITITFGPDTPQRRTFNGIAELNPKIGVITWEESETIYRYALVIETDDGIGAWCGAFDNTHRVR